MKDIKKRLFSSSTLPTSVAPFLGGNNPNAHNHGPHCGCGHHHHHEEDNDQEEE